MTASKVFPFLGWLKGYNAEILRSDLMAGISVGLLLIPQSMANAQLAGLPAHYGLYAVLLPTMIGGLFGSSKQMCNGMVALVGMMTAAALEPLAAAGSSGYIAYAVLLSFMVGLAQLAMGVLRLGFLVNFLSQPVINGFTNAVIILIALSQLHKIFGVTVEAAEYQFETLYLVLMAALRDAHWPSVLMACLAAAVIYAVPRLAPKIPAVLCAVVITTIVSWATGYEQKDYLPLAALKSPVAEALISEISFKGDELERMKGESHELKQRLQKTGYRNPDLLLDLKFQSEQLDIQASRVMVEMSIARTQLRALEFTRVEKEGAVFFYRKGEKVPGADLSDGEGGWRMLVGSGGVKDRLVFSRGGEVVGDVPAGLPSLSLPTLDFNAIWQLFPFALSIAFIGIASSISIAKTVARLNNDRIDPDQELIAQGLSNLAAGFSQTSPVAGSFSSTGMNISAGGKTGFSSVFAGLSTLLTLLFLTPLLYHLPQPVLATVVITAMIHQVHFATFRQEWKAQWYDGAVGVLTFAVTLAAAPQMHYGLIAGVTLSLVVLVYRFMDSGVTHLACGDNRRAVDERLVAGKSCRHIAVMRFQQSLFYINSSVLENHVVKLVSSNPELRHVHLVFTGINEVDSSGEEMLAVLVIWLRKHGVGLSVNGLNDKVFAVLERTGVLAQIGSDNIFHTLNEAINAVHGRVSSGEECADCPWHKLR